MYRGARIVVLLGILTMPLVTYGETPQDYGGLGENLGLDFYSRIDDAGDGLARAITTRRVKQYGTFGKFTQPCVLPSWIRDEGVSQATLENVRSSNLMDIYQIANRKKVTVTTDQMAAIVGCMNDAYNNLQNQALEDQGVLENVANIGLYMDGDTKNSDYDIVADIQKINTIIFKEEVKYTGTQNKSVDLLKRLTDGTPIAPLFGGTTSRPTASGSLSGTGGIGTSTTGSGGTFPPWLGVCTMPGDSTTLFGDDFITDLNNTLAGNGGGQGVSYDPTRGRGDAPGTNLPLTASGDFHHKHPCSAGDIFCITVSMTPGSTSLLGGWKNNSIETLLEKHIQMMEQVSWSDLSQQKMTNNSYQLPFLNIKIKNKIAGANVFMLTTPQPTRNLKKEDTKQKKDNNFDKAYKCAMATAGLLGDEQQNSGFIGAGYVYRTNTTLSDVPNMSQPLGPQQMDTLRGCYTTRINEGKKFAYQSFSTDLNEIQAFTQAINHVILEIIEGDKKLDGLPIK